MKSATLNSSNFLQFKENFKNLLCEFDNIFKYCCYLVLNVVTYTKSANKMYAKFLKLKAFNILIVTC